MNKSLLAFAVLTAVTGVASAQSSVTIYGKVDLGLVLDSGSAQGKSVRVSSGVTGGSRLGFKGVEDLGGGLKAAFQLETGYCADSAAGGPNFCTGGSFMGRQAHGDLTGAFGAISAGRQYTLGFTNLTTIDPFGTGFAGAATNLIEPSGVRVNNSVTYTTPTLGGFSASGEVALGETTGKWEAGRETGAGLNFSQGPLYLGATYYGLNNPDGNGTARKNYLVGGSYDFGVVKIHALGQRSTGHPDNKPNLTPIDSVDLLGGVTVSLAGGQVLASYIRHNDRTSDATYANGNEDSSQWAVGYLYPLSKRTSVYTSFAKIQNDLNSHGARAAYTVGNATEAGTGNKSFDFGIVHNF